MGNFLGMAGIDTLIIERNLTVNNGPRAIAFDDEGLRICQAMGLGQTLMEHVLPGLRADYFSAGRLFASASPTNRSNGYPLISTFHQPDFEHALFAGLSRFHCIQLCFQHTVESFEQTDAGVSLRVRTSDGELLQIECDYLLACNGGKHSLRRKLNIPLTGITYPQQWVVIDYVDDEGIQASPAATFFCNPERPAVTVMLPHQRRRWEFMLFPGETEEHLLQDERVQTLLRQVHGPRQPQMVRCTTYTFHAALAQRFSDERVFLLGDAAHMMPPFGGQGMNSCLRDAHNLAWKLAMVLHGLAQPSILDSYQEERHDHVASMIWFSSFLGQVVMTRWRSLAILRDLCFRLLNAIPYTHAYLSEIRFKPQPRIKKGGLFLRFNRASRRYAGQLLPQPTVQTSQGEHVLLDEVLGNDFALLRLNAKPGQAVQAFSALPLAPWHQLGIRFISIQPADAQPRSPTQSQLHILPEHETVQDTEHVLSAFLRHNANLYLLVRPDRYILGAFSEEEIEQCTCALQQLLGK